MMTMTTMIVLLQQQQQQQHWRRTTVKEITSIMQHTRRMRRCWICQSNYNIDRSIIEQQQQQRKQQQQLRQLSYCNNTTIRQRCHEYYYQYPTIYSTIPPFATNNRHSMTSTTSGIMNTFYRGSVFRLINPSTNQRRYESSTSKTNVAGTTTTDATTTDNSTTDNNLPQIIETRGVPIHLYANEIEKEAMDQVIVLAESPIPVDYVAVMADAHAGKGVTVGTVFASEHYVSPNAVGVDIGCGMAAIPIHGLYKKDLTDSDKNKIQQLIKERIPTGFTQHKHTLDGTKPILDEITAKVQPTKYLQQQLLLPRVTDQLGTLGGGNHFIEVLYTDDDQEQVWCMLHSGSRNIGNRVATYYDDIARTILQKQGINTISLNGMNYMKIQSQEGQDYLKDMEWCQQYAYYNRKMMKDILLQIIYEVMHKDADLDHSVNIHHNYCICQKCDTTNRTLYITRKGATSAALNEMGIIPGSMGTGSYITRGRGNRMSWCSSSHGAGRRMSRTKAHNNITQEEFERSMNGIVCDTHPSVKDEAPQAYKDLKLIMKQQASLTDIVHRLLPLINVKGFEKKLPKKYQKKSPGHYNNKKNQKQSPTIPAQHE